MANLSIGNDVIGPDKIDIVYFFPRNELINLIVRVDSSVFKFSLGNLKVCVGIDLDAKPLPPDKAASAEDRAAAPGRRPGRSERPAPRPSTAWSDGRPADSRPCPASRPRTGFPCRTPWNRPPWRRNGFAVDEHSRRHRSPASAPAFAIGWATSLTSSEKFPKTALACHAIKWHSGADGTPHPPTLSPTYFPGVVGHRTDNLEPAALALQLL
jgi:hypothetical protein